MTRDQLRAQCSKEWNALGKLPLYQWLLPSCSKQDKNRLDTLGNCVIPKQAGLAADLLSKLAGPF